MHLIPEIEDPDIARHILVALNLPARAPPLTKVTRRSIEPPGLEKTGSFDQSARDGWPELTNMTPRWPQGARAARAA